MDHGTDKLCLGFNSLGSIELISISTLSILYNEEYLFSLHNEITLSFQCYKEYEFQFCLSQFNPE